MASLSMCLRLWSTSCSHAPSQCTSLMSGQESIIVTPPVEYAFVPPVGWVASLSLSSSGTPKSKLRPHHTRGSQLASVVARQLLPDAWAKLKQLSHSQSVKQQLPYSSSSIVPLHSWHRRLPSLSRDHSRAPSKVPPSFLASFDLTSPS
jgi:hypothetical protein